MLLTKKVSTASIARIVGVSSTALRRSLQTGKLDPKVAKGGSRGPAARRVVSGGLAAASGVA
jgi:hypothetical protein